MDVILLERVPRLGTVGDIVKVKDGYARNFLLPSGKAERATAANKAKIASKITDLQAKNDTLKIAAEKIHKKLDGIEVMIIRQAGENGQLYGSVSVRDIADAINEKDFPEVTRHHIILNTPIKMIGTTQIPVAIHADVVSTISVIVARSADDANKESKVNAEILPIEAAEALFFDAPIEAPVRGAGLVG